MTTKGIVWGKYLA